MYQKKKKNSSRVSMRYQYIPIYSSTMISQEKEGSQMSQLWTDG